MSVTGGVLIHDFTSFSHLILRIKIYLVWLLGIGNFIFKPGHTYLCQFFLILMKKSGKYDISHQVKFHFLFPTP